MSNFSIEDLHYEEIKTYFLTPEQSTLPKSKQEILDRAVSAFKILEKNPVTKNAVGILRSLYPEISRSTAYRDIILAQRLFKTVHTFNYDFWRTWLIKDIVKNIQVCLEKNDKASMEVIAMENVNLIKLIGPKPEDQEDPRRNEKHEFYITASTFGRNDNIDMEELRNLPVTSAKELTRIMRSALKSEKKDFREKTRQLIDSLRP
jgi:hypothetical protein